MVFNHLRDEFKLNSGYVENSTKQLEEFIKKIYINEEIKKLSKQNN